MKNQIKNLITKIISILVIMLMMVNSSLMLVISVAVDAVQKIIDETKINAVYELNMEKYVNYKMGDKQGTLVQTYLKTGIEYQEGQEYVPIDTSNVIINTPKINDKYPESVEVVTKSTKATNGDGSGKDVNYAYNKENGQLQIITENKADDKGNIYTENVAGARDEYQLDFYYDANCYNDKNEKMSLEFKGNVELKLKDDRDIRKNQEISQNFEVAENVSGLVSADVTTSDIYNGYINANIQNNSAYSTGYAERIKIQTSYKEIADEITVNTKNLLVNNKDKENETQEIIYKNTKVNKNEILDKLGQDGYFQIIDKDGNVLATINKDTEADENGNVQIGYDGEKTELNFKFSKPLKLGDINILNTKEIKDTMKDANVTKVETRNTVSCVNNVTEKTKVIDEKTKEEKEVENTKQVEIYNYVGTSVAEIKEAKTDVKVTANNTNWTNNVQNDVTFTATLVTSGPEYNLFKNPVVDIKLPDEVEKVVLGESSILYDNGLQLGSVQVVDNNGSKVIRVKVNGTQTSYVQNEVVNGANIVIPASIILKKDIASSQENIAVSFANYRNAKSPETGNLDIPVNVTSIINNTASADEQGSNNGASANGVATSFAAVSAQTTLATANNTVVEAKPIDLDKISVEYKAFLGDKELANGDSVHENEYIKYVAKVRNNTGEDVNGLNVVASVPEGTTYVTIENRELTEDEKQTEKYDECNIIPDSNKKDVTVAIDIEKEKEKSIVFYVKVNELSKNETKGNINSNIKINDRKNEKQISTLNNNVSKAVLSVQLKGWETMRDVNIWRFVINVTNNGTKTLNDVGINLYKNSKFDFSEKETVENFSDKGRYWGLVIDGLEPGKTDERIIYLRAKTSAEENDQVDMLASAIVNGEEYYSNPSIQLIKNPNFKITQTSDKEGEKIKYGETVEYVYTIENKTFLPFACPITLRDYLDCNMEGLTAEYESFREEQGKYIKENHNLDMHVVFSDEEETVSAKFELYIPAGEKIKIKIKATPRIVTKEEEVTNYGVLSYKYNDTKLSKQTNTIKNIILPYNYVEPDPDNPNPDKPNPDKPDPDNPDKPDPDKPDPDSPNPDNPSENRYNISGLVWKDENKNGIRDSSEMLLSGITVKLFNIDTNEIVVVDNNKQIITTNQSGEYTFSGVGKGNYIVLFEYDTSKYKLTTYKSNTASEDTNSDVINKSVSIDGNEKEVGVTDTINISNQNKSHIDMGLIENGTYDLSLNKYITNVELTYGSQKQTYSYDNSKLAKVEIPAKKVDNAKVTIEYKIEVKNEGNVDAIIESIADYKPDGLDFDKSLNSEWNIDNQNKLTNVSMLGSKLEPGKTRSVTLYLTKTLSKDSMGTFTNSAEILKSTNLLNLKDVDSTEGNKDKSEDDYSEAQVILSVKTGIVLYTIIVLGVLLLLVGITILIKTKKIKINKIRGIAFSFIFIFATTIILSSNEVFAQQCWFQQRKSGDSGMWSSFVNNGYTFDTYNYYHHGLEDNSKRNGRNELYCSEGGHMARSDDAKYCYVYEVDSNGEYKKDGKGNYITKKCSEHHTSWNYEHVKEIDSWEEPVNEYHNVEGSEATMSVTNPGNNEVILGSNYVLVGPFNTTYVGQLVSYDDKTATYGCAAWGYDISGNYKIISGATFANKNGTDIVPASDSSFYLKIPNSENIKQITLLQLGCLSSIKTVDKYMIKKHETWKEQGNHYDAQILKNNISYHYGDTEAPEGCYSEKTDYYTASDHISLNIYIRGNLKVTKSDTDTKDSLNGAQFRITGPNNYDKTVKIEKDGTITIKDLFVGEYTVTETGAPENYRLNIQDNTTTTVNVTGGGTVDAKFTNKQYGDFKVTKKDKDTGKTTLGDIKLEGVQFKLYVIKNGTKYYLKNATQTKYSYDDFSETDRDKAKTYSTDANGQFSESNLPVKNGKDDIEYYIEEYALPEALKNYYKVKTTPDKITLINGNQQDKDILNKQIYIGLSGYVWEDVANPNKQTTRNDLYDEGETLVQGVTVRLKNALRDKVKPNGKGDINNDGKVDSTDLMKLLYYVSGRDVNLSADEIRRADINWDNKTNIQDLNLLVKTLEGGEVTSLGYGKGDLNKDGNVNITDLNLAMGYVSGREELSAEATKAADINNDGVVNVSDLMLLAKGIAPGDITVQNEGTIQTTTTNASGQYKFNKVKIDQLSNYYIEFEYNGLKYQSVAYHNQDNGSKAIEGDTTRDNFNNQYASITGGNAKGTTTTGYSKNASGKVTNNLTYTNGTYSSQLVQNTGYTVESAKKSVSAQNGSSGVSIKATTHETGYSLDKWSAGVTEIGKINLGIYKRAQTDMSILTDLKYINLQFKGHDHNYKYDKRILANGIDVFSEIQKWAKTDKEKEAEKDIYPRNYDFSIYKSYLRASAIKNKNPDLDLPENQKMEVYFDYVINIRNEESLKTTANEVTHYFCKSIDYNNSYYVDSKNNHVNINWTKGKDVNSNFSQISTTDLKNVKIDKGKNLEVHLIMKVTDETLLQWAEENKVEDYIYGTTEISSYSTYTDDGKYYAAIDNDSAPGNIKLGDVNTYEDDTDSAPTVKITFEKPKEISGRVFEDSTSDKLNKGAERKGNGIFKQDKKDKNDGFVDGVKVELREVYTEKDKNGKEIVKDRVANLYDKAVSDWNFDTTKATTTTTKKGEGKYDFVGIIPGTYYLKYTYSDGNVIYKNASDKTGKNVTIQDYKSTIISSNILKNAFGSTTDDNVFGKTANDKWYQDESTEVKGHSVAVDMNSIRKNINNEFKEITGNVKEKYSNITRSMEAKSPKIDIAIEKKNHEETNMVEERHRIFTDINFGIVERPRQSLKLTKTISNIKFALASGNTIIDGNPKNHLNYVSDLGNNLVKLEADNEILQGSQLDIEYTINISNESELNYDSVDYYRYGIKDDSKIVKTTINKVIDYIDQNVSVLYGDGDDKTAKNNWYIANAKKGQLSILTSKVQEKVKNRNKILLNNSNLTLPVYVKGKTDNQKNIAVVNAKKQLSVSNDMTYNNYAEIVSVTNSVGRFYGYEKDGKWTLMTPGNLNPYSGETHENDDDNEKLAIIPSTGDSTIVYYILGITCLGITICGIILIKKFVL